MHFKNVFKQNDDQSPIFKTMVELRFLLTVIFFIVRYLTTFRGVNKKTRS